MYRVRYWSVLKNLIVVVKSNKGCCGRQAKLFRNNSPFNDCCDMVLMV